MSGLTPLTLDGAAPRFGYPIELAQLRVEDIQRFPVLVVRRGPAATSAPPEYRREWSGRYYEVWSRRSSGQAALRGEGGEADCPALPTADEPLPSGWTRRTDDPSLVQTVGPGVVGDSLELAEPGRYELWLRGSFGREVDVRIDGRDVGTARDELAQPANWLDLGSLELDAGTHRVELVRSGVNLSPGNGDGPRTLGSLVLRRGQPCAPAL